MADTDRVTVIYNDQAGNVDAVAVEEVLSYLEEQGYAPDYEPTEAESDLDEILPDTDGLVVVCGGDGTLSAVLTRVRGRDDLEIAYLPLGTANNFGYSLGLAAGSLEALSNLASRPREKIDLGSVSLGSSQEVFAEGFGCGIYAELLHAYNPDLGKSVLRAFQSLTEVVSSFEPIHVNAFVDGHDVSGEYLIFTVLNTKRIGPRIELAPEASPYDGYFDVVGIKPDTRNVLLGYTEAMITGEMRNLENGVLRRGREVEISPAGFTYHLDTVIYDVKDQQESHKEVEDMICVRIDPGTATMILPAD